MASNPSVAKYYDSNTRRFLAVGGGGRSLSIHRHLWGPGVRTTEEAAGYVNRLLTTRISELISTPSPVILDMGCGVGGTLLHLAHALPESRLHGITISETQSRMATRLAEERGLSKRCRIHHGDFESDPLDVSADVIVAIESFVHGSSPENVLVWAAAHLGLGGHLIVVDDFVADGGPDVATDTPRQENVATDTPRRPDVATDTLRRPDVVADTPRQPEVAADITRQKVLHDFRSGWRAPSVCTVERMAEAGAAAELRLTDDDDLTPLIRLRRPRDRAIALATPLLRTVGLTKIPFFGNLVGGNALQTGLRTGLFAYRMLVFTKAV